MQIQPSLRPIERLRLCGGFAKDWDSEFAVSYLPVSSEQTVRISQWFRTMYWIYTDASRSRFAVSDFIRGSVIVVALVAVRV
ncbi:uncharacterized protein [Ambystoma mexicanum]|uniref:uncharacterized protein isoform X2 n=1 Tax=Ambystoma mexicanum TaxID=8296 RepID=UPI0037E96BE8